MKTNKDLNAFYESVYKAGETTYFSKFDNGKNKSENESIVLKYINVKDKIVLDIGCGTGSLVQKVAKAGAKKSIGIDYSVTAIQTAKEMNKEDNAFFEVTDFNKWTDEVDIITSCGTFEHLDDPQAMMDKITSLLKKNGVLILTCPHFYNIRGIIWITLQKLLNVPMSLTDVHSISPADMERWSKQSGLKLVEIETFDYDRGNGRWMLEDMKKRLTNALKDASLSNERVDDLLSWANDYINYNAGSPNSNKFDGATCLYKFLKV